MLFQPPFVSNTTEFRLFFMSFCIPATTLVHSVIFALIVLHLSLSFFILDILLDSLVLCSLCSSRSYSLSTAKSIYFCLLSHFQKHLNLNWQQSMSIFEFNFSTIFAASLFCNLTSCSTNFQPELSVLSPFPSHYSVTKSSFCFFIAKYNFSSSYKFQFQQTCFHYC